MKLIFEGLYDHERKRLFAQKRPEISQDVYLRYGWQKDDQGDWQPPPGLVPEIPADATAAAAVPDVTKMDEAKSVLMEIMMDVHGGETPTPEKPKKETGPGDGSDLFEAFPGEAPKTAPPPPAKKPEAAKPDVSDLFDEG